MEGKKSMCILRKLGSFEVLIFGTWYTLLYLIYYQPAANSYTRWLRSFSYIVRVSHTKDFVHKMDVIPFLVEIKKGVISYHSIFVNDQIKKGKHFLKMEHINWKIIIFRGSIIHAFICY